MNSAAPFDRQFRRNHALGDEELKPSALPKDIRESAVAAALQGCESFG
jgi:hypothetical protein